MMFSARFAARVLTGVAGVGLTAVVVAGGGTAVAEVEGGSGSKVMLKGSTTASYYWDDASGRAGDTGLPASGKPMQKGLAASPSWPLLTEGYVVYQGKKLPFFVGDRGPGEPSNRGVMLDLDAKTFAELTGGRFNADTLGVDGNGGKGHIKVDYVITKWGKGVGKKNRPMPFSTKAWSVKDRSPVQPVVEAAPKAAAPKAAAPAKAVAPKAAKAPAVNAAKAAAPKAVKAVAPKAASKTVALADTAAVAAGTQQQGLPVAAILVLALAFGGGGFVVVRGIGTRMTASRS